MRRISILALLATGTAPMAAIGQTMPAPPPAPSTPADEQDMSDEPDIIVTGQRNLPGSVIGDIPPEEQLGPADIRSYGVSSVADLLNELAPQTASGRGSGGAPVVLLNGKRISSFAEIRDLPTEAIARVDILPEEVALKYGYRADQKVVNIVLRRRFRATTAEIADKIPTAGGTNAPKGDLDLLHIRGDGRFNLHLTYQAQSPLTEAERDIPPNSTATDAVDQRPYRSLLPSSRDFTANSVYARTIFGDVSATLNATLEASDSIRTNGLADGVLTLPAGKPFSSSATDMIVDRTTGDLPLKQRSSALTGHLGATFNGGLGPEWRWSLTGNYDHSESKTFSETGLDIKSFQARLDAGDPTADPFGPVGGIGTLPANRAYATSNEAGLDALFTGPLFALPAGDVSTSIRIGADTSAFDSRSYRAEASPARSVSRGTVNGQINVDVPIASRSKDVLGVLGQLSANFNLAEDHLSDFGTLQTLGYGVNWSPVDAVRVIASHTDQDQAPSAQQIGNPLIVTPNVRVFDYVRGTTASVTTVAGGNPGLIADNNHVTKIALTLKPWSKTDISLIASYVASRTDNPIAAFPTATAAIEEAFRDRFTRDDAGNLTRIDMRPINFAQSSRSQLRWGINFSKPLKSKVQKELEAFRAGTGPNPLAGLPNPRNSRRPGGAPGDAGTPPGGGARADAPPGQGDGDRAARGSRGGFGGRGGGFGRGGRGGGGGRLQFALYHTWHFKDEVLVKAGGPRLDLLDGDAIGSGGGQSRHEFEAQAGYSNNGTGIRLSGKYQTGTRVNGGSPGAPEPLDFSGLGTVDLRVFADLGQKLDLLKSHPWLRGTRVSLQVGNLFNGKQRVTDATGRTPVSYQPDYLDPLGRSVRISIRKLFF